MQRYFKDNLIMNATILSICATIFLGLVLFSTNSIAERVMFGIFSGILCIIAILLFIVNNKMNSTKKKNRIDLNNLTFEEICNKIDLYIPICIYSKSEDSWFDKNIAEKYRNNENQIFTKLIYYRLLYVWIDESEYEEYERFGQLSREDIQYLVTFMHEFGDEEISEKLLRLNNLYDGNVAELKDFFESKKDYLKKSIIECVMEHYDEINVF